MNNNAVITNDVNGKEVIVMGKGIAYGRKMVILLIQRKLLKSLF
nr:CAT RNA binding domain-containing protein [Clostridium beijerinckii]